MEKAVDILKNTEDDLEIERPRTTLVEIVADKLREFILLEKLPPGAAISERDVATALGVSRTPLRGALAILEQDGLVEYSITRRPRVADPSFEEISQNLVVMGALEALAGELACIHASDSEIEQIIELQNQMEVDSAILEPLEFFSTDMKMHEMIVRTTGNQPLIDTHKKYNARLWRARFVSSKRSDRRGQTLGEHSAITQALAKRDGEAIARALRSHLTSTVNNIALALEEQEKGTL